MIYTHATPNNSLIPRHYVVVTFILPFKKETCSNISTCIKTYLLAPNENSTQNLHFFTFDRKQNTRWDDRQTAAEWSNKRNNRVCNCNYYLSEWYKRYLMSKVKPILILKETNKLSEISDSNLQYGKRFIEIIFSLNARLPKMYCKKNTTYHFIAQIIL